MSRLRLTTVDDLFTLSDGQLGEFMEEHRRPNGSFELPVDGWNKLSQRERDHLAERLRSMKRAVAKNSRPLDLDKLNALLRDVSSKDISVSRERERQTKSPPD
ncbi:hypothetical protein MAJ_11488, partial [Metarhizium majus ARSEF 297]